jgi:transposase-like protein
MSTTKSSPQLVPDPEVRARTGRRTFTAEYKAKILAECDGATAPGAIGAILRREGLYSSHLVDWRRDRALGELEGLAPKKRDRKPKAVNPLSSEVARLERENARLQDRLRRAEILLEAQKKLSEVLGIQLQDPERTGSGG